MKTPNQLIILKMSNNLRLERTPSGHLPLTDENLLAICISDELYDIPEYNKKLYLHFKNIKQLASLRAYTNLTTLYLENNSLKELDALSL